MYWIQALAVLTLAVVISCQLDYDMERLYLSLNKTPVPFAPMPKYNDETHYELVEEGMNHYYSPCRITHSGVQKYGFENQPPHSRYFYRYGEYVAHGTVVHFGCNDGQMLTVRSPSWDLCQDSIWVKLDSEKKPRCVVDGGECKIPYIPYANMTLPITTSDTGMVEHLTQINVTCEHGSYPKFETLVIVCSWGNWHHWVHRNYQLIDEFSSLCSQPETYHIKQTTETESLSDLGFNNHKGGCTQLYVPGTYDIQNGTVFASSFASHYTFRKGTLLSLFCFNTDKPPAVGSKFITCSDGSWKFPLGFPNCQMDCEIPAMLIYGAELLISPNVRWIRDTGRLGFKCADGFRMVKNSRFNPSVICANGQWKTDPQRYGFCAIKTANRDNIGTNYRRDESDLPRHVDQLRLLQHANMFGVPCSLPHLQRLDISINDSMLVQHGTFREIDCLPEYEQIGDTRVFCYNGVLSYRLKPFCLEKERKVCRIPFIEYSQLNAKRPVPSGTRLEVKCIPGYHVVGSSHLFCQVGKWYTMLDKDIPICVQSKRRDK